MGYINVKFLGKSYQVSKTINEFLQYDELLTPIRTKIIQELSKRIGEISAKAKFGEEMTDYMESICSSFKKIMTEGCQLLVDKSLSLGVYDVTLDSFLKNTTSFADIEQLSLNTMEEMLSEGRKYVAMKNAGIELAYKSAASNITGSGVAIFTSSIATMMLYSFVEKQVLLSQAKKADKEYENAVRNITNTTKRSLDKMCMELLISKFYPSLMNILLDFDSKIMSIFLSELVEHNKFDFSSVEKYDMDKAEKMLSNIDKISDKTEFLRKTFEVCPFCYEVYEMCLNQNLLDWETFETANHFGFAEALIESIKEKVRNNTNDSESINQLVIILAKYTNSDELSVKKEIYSDKIRKIEESYTKLRLALKDNVNLDKFIREFISPDMMDIVVLKPYDVEEKIKGIISNILSDEISSDLIKEKMIDLVSLRKDDSMAVTIQEINQEYIDSIKSLVLDYVSEATKRYERYKKSKSAFDKLLSKLQSELKQLESQKESLGFFSFSKKKELSLAIEEKNKEISKLKETHEYQKLRLDFYAMYEE